MYHNGVVLAICELYMKFDSYDSTVWIDYSPQSKRDTLSGDQTDLLFHIKYNKGSPPKKNKKHNAI